MKTQQQIINTLINTIKTNKAGFTLKYTTLKPYIKNKGFAVSITNIKSKKPLIAIKKLLLCLKCFNQIKNNLYIGGWYNKEDNYAYIDLSLILDNQEQIKTIGFLFNQIAYFDFKTFESINFNK